MLFRSFSYFSVAICSALCISASWSQGVSQEPSPPADEIVYQLHQEFARSPLAPSAFGAYFDTESKEQIIVMPADVDLQLAEESAGQMRVSPRRLRQTRLTRSSQAQLEQLIITRRYHPDAAKFSMGTYFDLKSGKQILITDAPSTVTRPLLKAYPDQVDVQFGTIVTTASRLADRAKFSGAAGTKGEPDGGYCTSSWKVRRGTVPGMLIAGHCQGPTYPYWVDTWDGFVFGKLSNKSVNPDVGFIYWDTTTSPGWSDEGRPYIYVGGVNSTTTKGVHGGRDPALNSAIYYRSGSVTGEVSGLTVTSLSAAYTDQNGNTHTNAMAYTSPTPPQGGDSGAPIYVYSTGSTGVHVRGIHVANGSNGTHFAEKYTRAMFSGSILLCSSPICYEGS